MRTGSEAMVTQARNADGPSAAARAELYVYYRLPAATRAASLGEVRHLQTCLRAAHADLEMHCLVRDDDAPAGVLTCMEIYRHPEGLDAALQADIEATMSAWPTQRLGPRHVERFVAA